jgi:two-component system cell cycle sensor histidine kinase/response regulator CckA
VEKDELLRELTANLLRSGGCTVEEVADANAVLEIARRSSSSVQLVLTDVIMPGMSGGELIAQLPSIQPSLAVLFMSGYASDLIAHAGIAEPEKLLIQKPFTKKSLLTEVRSVLDEMAGS